MTRKFGPHGQLFACCLLIHEELAMKPVNETFGPFFNADIRAPFFSDVLKSAKAPLVKAMWAMMCCTSSVCMGLATRSPFSQRIGSCGLGHAVTRNA